MSITIKVLVEFNKEKYTVLVESEYKLVKFKTVSNEIITQLNQNISLKTHLFELFDRDFGEYVLVTNDNQIVENLSKIRVKTKESKEATVFNDCGKDGIDCVTEKLDQLAVGDNGSPEKSSGVLDKDLRQFCDYLFGTNPKNFIENNVEDKSVSKNQSIGSSAKPLNNKIENNLSEKTKDLAKYLFNSSDKSSDKLINKEINVNKDLNTAEDLNSESTDDTVIEASNQEIIRNSGQSATEPPSEAVNYLELEESNNYKTTRCCPHLYHKTFVEKFRRQSVVTIRIRYEDFKAIQTLLDLLDINRRCFQKNPSNEDPLNPKWRTISDQMINNGFDDWTAKQCKDGFNNALHLYRKCLDKCPDYDIAAKINPLFSAFHVFDMKYIISLAEFNVIRDLRDLFGRKLSKFSRNSGFSSKFSSNQSLDQRNRFDDFSATKSTTNQSVRIFRNSARNGSNMSLNSMSNGFETKTISKNRSQIDKLKLKNIGLKVDNYLIKSFKALAKSVETINAQFGHVSANRHFWELVSNQMKANGYESYPPHNCYRMFTEHVCDYYSLALTYCSDTKNAQKVYPLFEFIHSMDLSQSLSQFSFNKISELRKKFEQKSDFFQQMFAK